jgi:hypothetical protein
MKPEGVTKISPVLADAIGLRRENAPQNNSFSASDGEGGRRPDDVNREIRETRERRIDADKVPTHTPRMAMKSGSELTSHPMVRGIFELTRPLIVDESRAKTLTTADLYSLNVFDAVSHLIQSFQLLERSRCLTILMPSEKYLKGLNINRYEWLEYHISTFLVAFATVGDEALLLVNEVQCLGINPKDCRAGIVKGNKWVKDTQIPKRLNAIEKAIEPHKNARNLLVHRGKTPSLDKLCKTDGIDQLRKISFVLQHRPEAFPEIMRSKTDHAFVKAFIQIDKTLNDEICMLRETVWHLLTTLHEFYDQRLSILSTN